VSRFHCRPFFFLARPPHAHAPNAPKHFKNFSQYFPRAPEKLFQNISDRAKKKLLKTYPGEALLPRKVYANSSVIAPRPPHFFSCMDLGTGFSVDAPW